MYKALEKLVETGKLSKEDAEATSKDIYEGEHKSDLSSIRDEAKTYRKKYEDAISAIDKMTEQSESMQGKLSSLDKDLEKAREEGRADSIQVIEQERTKHKELMDTLSSVQTENTKLSIDNEISNAIGGYDIKNDLRKTAVNELRMLIKKTDNGIVYGDGLSVEDGIKGYFDERMSLLNSKGNGGGSGANDGGGSGNTKTKSRDEFEKMNPAQKATFMNDGGKLIA